MYISSVQLNNFRNYEMLDINLDQNINIFYGDNAQGKTNFLEALYLCGTTKSHRGSKDRDIIQFNKEESHIRMIVVKKKNTYRIDMHLKKNQPKGVAINGVPIKRASELFGIINLVFFSPEDLNIIKKSPGERRRFMDSELCQLNSLYLSDLSAYNHVVNQRNKLLKDISFHPELIDTLSVWDTQMVQYGSKIIESREKFIETLNSLIGDIHEHLTGHREKLEIFYNPNVEQTEFEEELQKNRQRDMKFKMSMTGPHRDDFCILSNGIDVRRYGSQGQQRTAALSLKLSEIELVKQVIHDIPVLLLDDVLSELDSNRQNYLLNYIHSIQTLITCTGLDDFVSHRFHIDKIFNVVCGNVSVSH